MNSSVGQRALVTGGANGIGAAICARLAKDGFDVTLCDKDSVNGEAVASDIGGRFEPIDAEDFSQIESLFQRADPFEVLVNNIGSDQHAFFTKTDPSSWRRLLSINLESALSFTYCALAGMQKKRYGRIVTIGSEAGRQGSKGGSVYAAAKSGLVGFTKSIARENARYAITANLIVPGPIMTPMIERGVEEVGDRLLQNLADITLVGRLGRPEEVAAAAAFFASPDASFITGEVLGVSGGMGC